jgi:hypothetical protein
MDAQLAKVASERSNQSITMKYGALVFSLTWDVRSAIGKNSKFWKKDALVLFGVRNAPVSHSSLS